MDSNGGLEIARNRVGVICREKHVLRDVNLDPMAFPDGDGGWMLMKRSSTLALDCDRHRSDAGFIGFASGFVVALIVVRRLGCARDNAKCNRRAEYLGIVVVDFVFESSGSGLVETVELVAIPLGTILIAAKSQMHT